MHLNNKVILLTNLKVSRLSYKTNTCFYKVLGLEQNCSQEDIKNAFYSKSLLYHPDRNHNSDKNEIKMNLYKFQDITAAYDILGNPEKRNNYDISISKGAVYQIIPQTNPENIYRKNRHDPRYRSSPTSADPVAFRLYERFNRMDRIVLQRQEKVVKKETIVIPNHSEFDLKYNSAYCPDFGERSKNAKKYNYLYVVLMTIVPGSIFILFSVTK